MTRDPYQTPGAIILLARQGYGVDDIRVKSGWSYREIAETLAPVNLPLAKLAGWRAVESGELVMEEIAARLAEAAR